MNRVSVPLQRSILTSFMSWSKDSVEFPDASEKWVPFVKVVDVVDVVGVVVGVLGVVVDVFGIVDVVYLGFGLLGPLLL